MAVNDPVDESKAAAATTPRAKPAPAESLPVGVPAAAETAPVAKAATAETVTTAKQGATDTVPPAKSALAETAPMASQPLPETAQAAKQPQFRDFEMDVAEFEAAITRRQASFDQLTSAINYIEADLPSAKKQIASYLYPKVLKAFEEANGPIVSIYPSQDIGCWAALTTPCTLSRFERFVRRLNLFGSYPPRDPQFHFFYDLTAAGVQGAHLLARVEQLGKEAPRLLSGRDLYDCVARLYSTATDLIGVLEQRGKPTGSASEQLPPKDRLPQAAGDGQASTVAKDRRSTATFTDLLAVIQQNLDQLELRYLKTPARALYFKGAMVGVGLATFVTLFGIAFGFDNLMLQMWLAGAVGGMLSVMQRLNDDKLDVHYEVGSAAIVLAGTVRPILGAFAAFLTLLLVLSRIVPLPVGTGSEGYYLVVLAFAAGFAERSIPDIVQKVQDAHAGADSTPSASR
jgi:hypothetical protein